MLQVFYLNVPIVYFRRAHIAMTAMAGGQRLAAVAASAPPWITAPHACAAAACMWVRGTERVWSGPHICVGIMDERVACVGPGRGRSRH
jgi:hypothetical protein